MLKTLIEKEIGKGVSMRQLAKGAGVSLGTIQNILYGDTELKNSTIEKISRYFNRPVYQSSPDTDPSKDKTIATLVEMVNSLQEEIKRLRDKNRGEIAGAVNGSPSPRGARRKS